VRVLIVQRSLSPPGGGNAVAAWMVHALAEHHHIATLTGGEWSPAETNAFYGTAIPQTIERRVIPAPLRWLSRLPQDRITSLRMSSVLRYARQLSAQFDLLVTADNFAAFTKPGLQYVHFPAGLHPEAARWRPLVNVYFALCQRLAGSAWAGAANNVTLVNSQWTADGITRRGEVSKPIVLYPPVLDPGSALPWADRDDVFLCVGRFHQAKRIETAIAIVKQARAEAMPGARLVIVGSTVDAPYTARLKTIAQREGNWIELREDLTRPELNALMTRSRYGIQAMIDEHFGIATAEMTRAGCLVFAHRSGGSVEVLNHEDTLLWVDETDAARKIAAIRHADAGPLQSRLIQHAQRFSPDAFEERFREIVARSRQLAEARFAH
jgi:glycosyltransferase involved in cell wall biosynthesis